jgi:hypothetical protein
LLTIFIQHDGSEVHNKLEYIDRQSKFHHFISKVNIIELDDDLNGRTFKKLNLFGLQDFLKQFVTIFSIEYPVHFISPNLDRIIMGVFLQVLPDSPLLKG